MSNQRKTAVTLSDIMMRVVIVISSMFSYTYNTLKIT